MSDAPDTKLAAFRAEARAWLEANFPSSLKGRGNVGGEARLPGRETPRWKQRMADRGWGRAHLAGGLWRRRSVVQGSAGSA